METFVKNNSIGIHLCFDAGRYVQMLMAVSIEPLTMPNFNVTAQFTPWFLYLRICKSIVCIVIAKQ